VRSRRRARREHTRLLVEPACTETIQGELVDIYARSAFEDTRRKAANLGAIGGLYDPGDSRSADRR
jgi:hypothetical protein